MAKMKFFHRLWISDSFSDVGTAAYTFAVPVMAVTFYSVNDAQLGWLMAAVSAVPGVFGLLLGAVADRAVSLRALKITVLIRIALYIAGAIFYLRGSLSLTSLVLITVLIEICSLYYDLILAGLVPRIVQKSELARANSLVETAETVTSTAGQAIGSFVFARGGFLWVLAFNLICNTMNYIGLASLHSRFAGLKSTADQGAAGQSSAGERGNAGLRGSLHPRALQQRFGACVGRIWKQMRGNWSYFQGSKVLTTLTVNGMLFNACIGMIVTLVTPYALTDLGVPLPIFGLMNIPAVGLSLTVPFVVPKLTRSLGLWKTIILATCIAGCSVVLMWLATGHGVLVSTILLAVGMALLDFSALIAVVCGRTLRQHIVDEDRQAGIHGLIKSLTWGVDPLSAIGAGLISSYLLGRHLTLLLTSVFPLIGVLLMVLSVAQTGASRADAEAR